MSDQIQGGIVKAMHLMKEGELAAATAAIQRVLGGSSLGTGFASGSSPDAPDGPAEPIDTESRVVDEAPQPAASPLLFGSLPLSMLDDLSLIEPDSMPLTMLGGLPRLPGASLRLTEGEIEPAIVPRGGRFVERSYTNQAGTRSYKLYIPSGYIGQEVPLVVVLHGCTQGPDDIAAGTQMNRLAEESIFLVAYPAQAQGANMNKCWNWFKASDQQRGRGEPSLVSGITRQVIDEYNVADDRVYVAGMSAGGAMAAIMAEVYPDLYAAVGIHSGLAPGTAHDLRQAL